MTRPGLRRPIPHGFVALALCTVALVSALPVVPESVSADTPGGQASIYGGIPQTFNICTGFEPPFFNNFVFQTATGQQTLSSRLVVVNTRSSSVTFFVRATASSGGSSFARTVTIAGNGVAFIGAFEPQWTAGSAPGGSGAQLTALPNNFQGTLRGFNCENLRLPAAVELGVVSTTRSGVGAGIEEGLLPSSSATGDLAFALQGIVATTTPTPALVPTVTPTPSLLFGFVPTFTQPASGCAIASPLFVRERDGMNSTIVVRNEGDSQANADVRVRTLGGGALTTRSFDIPPHGTLTLTGSQLSLPEGFAGSIRVDACPPRRNASDISGLVFHDSSNGDRTSLEAVTDVALPGFVSVGQAAVQIAVAKDVFVPVAHNNDEGFNSQIVLQNTHLVNDITAQITFSPDNGAEVVRSVTVRAESATSIDMAQAPQGKMSVRIEGPDGALDPRLLVAVYQMGPDGMAAASNGFAVGSNRQSLPLLFRASGLGGGYDSFVRVMKIRPGAMQPRITLRDRDTNDRLGPFPATNPDGSDHVLREGQGLTWDISKIPGVQAGHYYAGEVDTEESGTPASEFVAVSSYLNVGRRTFGAYGAVATRAAPRFYTGPVVVKNVDGLNTGIELQDLAGRQQTVTIRFFESRGNRVTTITQGVPENGSSTVYLPTESDVPDGTYSVEISSTDRLGVAINTVRYR